MWRRIGENHCILTPPRLRPSWRAKQQLQAPDKKTMRSGQGCLTHFATFILANSFTDIRPLLLPISLHYTSVECATAKRGLILTSSLRTRKRSKQRLATCALHTQALRHSCPRPWLVAMPEMEDAMKISSGKTSMQLNRMKQVGVLQMTETSSDLWVFQCFHICWPPSISTSLAAESSVIWYNSFSATCKTTSERAKTRDTKLAQLCRGLLHVTCVTPVLHVVIILFLVCLLGTDRFWLAQWGI